MTDLMIAYAEKCQAMGLPVHDGDGPRVDPEAGWEAPHEVLGNPLLGTSLDAEIQGDNCDLSQGNDLPKIHPNRVKETVGGIYGPPEMAQKRDLNQGPHLQVKIQGDS